MQLAKQLIFINSARIMAYIVIVFRGSTLFSTIIRSLAGTFGVSRFLFVRKKGRICRDFVLISLGSNISLCFFHLGKLCYVIVLLFSLNRCLLTPTLKNFWDCCAIASGKGRVFLFIVQSSMFTEWRFL